MPLGQQYWFYLTTDDFTSDMEISSEYWKAFQHASRDTAVIIAGIVAESQPLHILRVQKLTLSPAEMVWADG
jgi:hypothetical protein